MQASVPASVTIVFGRAYVLSASYRQFIGSLSEMGGSGNKRGCTGGGVPRLQQIAASQAQQHATTTTKKITVAISTIRFA